VMFTLNTSFTLHSCNSGGNILPWKFGMLLTELIYIHRKVTVWTVKTYMHIWASDYF